MSNDASGQGRGGAAFSLGTVAATASLWLALAALILMLRRTPPRALLEGPSPAGVQALAGAVCGVVIAGSQLLLLRLWPAWRRFTREAVAQLRLGWGQIVAIALMVAAAEELFFRAALQPLLGLGLSSAIFAVVHMRYDRAVWARETLGFGLTALLILFLVSLALGTVFARFGLLAAMPAHFAYDVIMLGAYAALPGARAEVST